MSCGRIFCALWRSWQDTDLNEWHWLGAGMGFAVWREQFWILSLNDKRRISDRAQALVGGDASCERKPYNYNVCRW